MESSGQQSMKFSLLNPLAKDGYSLSFLSFTRYLQIQTSLDFDKIYS